MFLHDRYILVTFLLIVSFMSVSFFHSAYGQNATSSGQIDVLTQATIVLAAVTTALVIVSFAQLWMNRNEMKNRVRPWVGRDSGNSGKLTLPKPHEPKAVQIRLHNNGSLPARNVTVKWYASDSKPSQDVFDSEKSSTHPGEPDDMLPNEGFTYTFLLPDDKYTMAIKETLYFGFRVTYQAGNYWRSKNGKYELRGHWNVGKEFVDHVAVD